MNIVKHLAGDVNLARYGNLSTLPVKVCFATYAQVWKMFTKDRIATSSQTEAFNFARLQINPLTLESKETENDRQLGLASSLN